MSWDRAQMGEKWKPKVGNQLALTERRKNGTTQKVPKHVKFWRKQIEILHNSVQVLTSGVTEYLGTSTFQQ